MPSPTPTPTKTNAFLWFGFLPAVLTFLFYLPVLHDEFVAWDDQVFIFDNPQLKALNPTFFHWMWTNLDTGNWVPLSWLSLALDYQIGGWSPWIYHLDNLILHTLNTILVYFVSLQILKISLPSPQSVPPIVGVHAPLERSAWIASAAGLTALLFGLHPIHVESVAWAAERRDVLCAFFFLLSSLFYLEGNSIPTPSTPGPRINNFGRWKKILSLLFFLAALLSKAMAVTLPLVLLILDVWPLGRFREGFKKLITEKYFYFLASLITGTVTYIAQSRAGAMNPTENLPLDFRVMNACHSIGFYLMKFVAPLNLVPYYPLASTHQVFSLSNLGGALVVVTITLACWYFRSHRPYALAAWSYFLVTLAPVLGLLQIGLQACADRYTYLPSLGIFLLISAALAYGLRDNWVVLVFSGLALTASLGLGTLHQLTIWNNSIALWESTVRFYPDTPLPHANLARAYAIAGKADDALREFEQASSYPPPNAHMHVEIGAVYISKNRVDDAIQEFWEAQNLYGTIVPADLYLYLWYAYERKDDQKNALEALQQSIQVDPDFAEAYSDLGITYWNLKNFGEAEKAFQTACSLDTANPNYLDSLGSFYLKTGQLDAATTCFNKGILLMPRDPAFHEHLGDLYMAKRQYALAATQYKEAQDLQPSRPDLVAKWQVAYGKIQEKSRVLQKTP
jgi:tetratricopeptide (TPR) repeat protein